MKFLIDQNISSQIIESIQDLFEGSSHVNQLDLNTVSDFKLWKYALNNQFILVTTDKSFFNFCFLHSKSPKVVYVTGDLINCTKLEWVLRINEKTLIEFSESEILNCLELTL